MHRRHIPIADDDPRDEELTLAALEEYLPANKVAVLHDGEETLDDLSCRGKLNTLPPGDPFAVLLDLKMPKVNRIEVLKLSKSDEHLKKTFIVVLTSSRAEPDLKECDPHGVNAYAVPRVDFAGFRKAMRLLGVFWVAFNENRRCRKGRQKPRFKAVNATPPAKKKDKNETPAPHRTSGG